MDAFCRYDLKPEFTRYPSSVCNLFGCNDSNGDESYNEWLSLQRTDAVKDYLSGNCWVPNLALVDRLRTYGFGENHSLKRGGCCGGAAGKIPDTRLIVLIEIFPKSVV